MNKINGAVCNFCGFPNLYIQKIRSVIGYIPFNDDLISSLLRKRVKQYIFFSSVPHEKNVEVSRKKRSANDVPVSTSIDCEQLNQREINFLDAITTRDRCNSFGNSHFQILTMLYKDRIKEQEEGNQQFLKLIEKFVEGHGEILNAKDQSQNAFIVWKSLQKYDKQTEDQETVSIMRRMLYDKWIYHDQQYESKTDPFLCLLPQIHDKLVNLYNNAQKIINSLENDSSSSNNSSSSSSQHSLELGNQVAVIVQEVGLWKRLYFTMSCCCISRMEMDLQLQQFI